MVKSIFNLERIFNEFIENGDIWIHGIDGIKEYQLFFEEEKKTMYFLNNDILAEEQMKNLGFLVLPEVMLIDLVRKEKKLDSIFEFDKFAKLKIMTPYGIFVKDSKLYVSDNVNYVPESEICGFYSGKMTLREQLDQIRISYLD